MRDGRIVKVSQKFINRFFFKFNSGHPLTHEELAFYQCILSDSVEFPTFGYESALI